MQCLEVFHEYFHKQEQENLGDMTVAFLVCGGGNRAFSIFVESPKGFKKLGLNTQSYRSSVGSIK